MQTLERKVKTEVVLDREEQCRRETIQIGSKLAFRAVILHAILGSSVSATLVWLMKPAIISSAALIKSGNDFSWALMPLVIFFFVGAIYGGLSGWRIVNASGMTGLISWAIGTAGVALVTIVAAIAALSLFPAAGSIVILWICVAVFAGGGILGMTTFTVWLA